MASQEHAQSCSPYTLMATSCARGNIFARSDADVMGECEPGDASVIHWVHCVTFNAWHALAPAQSLQDQLVLHFRRLWLAASIKTCDWTNRQNQLDQQHLSNFQGQAVTAYSANMPATASVGFLGLGSMGKGLQAYMR